MYRGWLMLMITFLFPPTTPPICESARQLPIAGAGYFNFDKANGDDISCYLISFV